MKIKITQAPPQNGLSVEGDQYKTLSSDGINLGGQYHSNGGTMVSSNGELVEAEKNEPIYTGSDGSNYVFGNVTNPFTGKLFKKEGKALLEDKGKAEKALDKANEVVAGADPHSKFGSLDYNTGLVQMDAAKIETTQLKEQLDNLAQIQEGILAFADATGADPKNLGKTMKKNGGKIKAKITGLPVAKDGAKLNPYEFLTNIFSNPNPPLPPTPQQQVQQVSPVQAPQPNPTDAAAVTDWLQNSPEVWGNPGFTPPQVRDNSQGTLAQRNNNPGNLRFNNQTGAVKGDAGFAKFNSYDEGFQALINDIKAKQTGKTRTGLGPNSTIQDLMNVYSPASDSNNPVKLANTLSQGLGVPVNSPIGQLDTQQLAKLISINEDAAYSNSQGVNKANTTTGPTYSAPPPLNLQPNYSDPVTPESAAQSFGYNAPNSTSFQTDPRSYIDNSATPRNPFIGNQSQTINQPQRPKRNTLTPLDYLGEIAAIVDRPDYVQGDQFNPTLMTPYRVSFQDQLNANQGSYNAIARNSANNPEALATLQGQKYQQDQGILANQFRTNQGVQNQVLNQNNQILNQAAMTNLQLRQQQADRQAQAVANTESNRQNALNSISSKVSQNNRYNNELQAQYDSQQRQANLYGNLYQNYQFDQQGNAVFNDLGGYNFNYGGPGANTSQANYYQYQAQQKQLKKQAEAEAAKNVATKAFGYKFN